MTQEQYDKADKISIRKRKLVKVLDDVKADIKRVKENYSNSGYDLRGTSLTLYRDDVLIILGTKHAWLTAEIQFLEKQLALI